MQIRTSVDEFINFILSLGARMSKGNSNPNDTELKEQGNKLFSQRKYEEAVCCYSKAIVSRILLLSVEWKNFCVLYRRDLVCP